MTTCQGLVCLTCRKAMDPIECHLTVFQLWERGVARLTWGGCETSTPEDGEPYLRFLAVHAGHPVSLAPVGIVGEVWHAEQAGQELDLARYWRTKP